MGRRRSKEMTLFVTDHYQVKFDPFKSLIGSDEKYEVLNIPNKSINLFDLSSAIVDNNSKKVVAMGDVAAKALELTGMDYFKLPIPGSLNDVYTDAILEEFRKWLKIN